MILTLLNNVDFDHLYQKHIQSFKCNFFKYYNCNKKIILFNSDFCQNINDVNIFKYLCRLCNLCPIYIIIDCNDKTITLAYNKSKIYDNYNLAFYGNLLNNVNKEIKFYDKIDSNFDISKQNIDYYICQDIKIKYDNLQYDKDLLNVLSYLRKYKTDYELSSIIKANKLALIGHVKIRKIFESCSNDKGMLNEISLYHQYLSACRQLNRNLPYDPIVALNSASSILHYDNMIDYNQKVSSLLIDAGVQYNGYASDITKTYSNNDQWNIYINQLKAIQKQIIHNIHLHHNFSDIHLYSRKLITQFLIKNEFLININNDSKFDQYIIDNELDIIFYMHGLGHLIGLNVHDIGGNLQLQNGKIILLSDNKKINFKIENNIVFTIEPGFYINLDYISLFDCPYINMKMVSQYAKFGGIRIENNIMIYNDTVFDITTLVENNMSVDKIS